MVPPQLQPLGAAAEGVYHQGASIINVLCYFSYQDVFKMFIPAIFALRMSVVLGVKSRAELYCISA